MIDLSNIYNNKANLIEKEEMYYKIRKNFNEMKESRAVYFYFLMKVGFNGVYRENKKGFFNVPFGRKEKFIVNENDLLAISKLIKNVHFYNLPYDRFLKMLEKKNKINDSFVYCDPPYIPEDFILNKKQELYTNNNFDHIDFVNKLNDYKNADIMISMSESGMAKKIYGKKFNQKKLTDIVRTINPQKLFKSQELLFLNYFIKK